MQPGHLGQIHDLLIRAFWADIDGEAPRPSARANGSDHAKTRSERLAPLLSRDVYRGCDVQKGGRGSCHPDLSSRDLFNISGCQGRMGKLPDCYVRLISINYIKELTSADPQKYALPSDHVESKQRYHTTRLSQ